MKKLTRGEIIGGAGIIISVVLFFLTRKNSNALILSSNQSPALTPVGLAAASIPAPASYGGSTFNFLPPSLQPATSNFGPSHDISKLIPYESQYVPPSNVAASSIPSGASGAASPSQGCSGGCGGCSSKCSSASTSGISQGTFLSSISAVTLLNQYKNLLSVN